MHRPAIASLNSTQRQEIITKIKENKWTFHTKVRALEALSFCDDLIEDLRTSKVNKQP